jgi:hypothetical protein
MYGLNLERITLDEILYEFDSSDIPLIITAVSFITLLMNWYNNKTPSTDQAIFSCSK